MTEQNVSNTDAAGNTEPADINALHLAPLTILDLQDLRDRKTEQLGLLLSLRVNAGPRLLNPGLMDELIQDLHEHCQTVTQALLARIRHESSLATA